MDHSAKLLQIYHNDLWEAWLLKSKLVNVETNRRLLRVKMVFKNERINVKGLIVEVMCGYQKSQVGQVIKGRAIDTYVGQRAIGLSF